MGGLRALLPRWNVRRKRPANGLAGAGGAGRAVPAPRRGRLPADLLPGARRPPHREDAARRDLRPLPAPARRIFRPAGIGHAAVEAHLQHRAGGAGDHRLDHRVHPRLADHRGAARLPVLPELAADALQSHRGPADRLPGPAHQPAVPTLQRTNPGLDGRRHAGCEGGDRGAARRPRLQCTGARGPTVRGGHRAQPRLAHEDDAHAGAQQPGRAVDLLDRPRRRAVPCDPRCDRRAG